MQALITNGESDAYLMKPLHIKRGSIIDIFYDFAPDAQGDTLYDGGEFGDQQTYIMDGGVYNSQFALEADMGGFDDADDPYDFPIDNSIVINRFYITEPRIDTVSIQYVCKIMPYKFDADKEQTPGQDNNGDYLNFDSDQHKV